MSFVIKRAAPETDEERRKRTMARVALASNVVGLTAGTAGLYSAVRDPNLRGKVGANIKPKPYELTRNKKLLAGGAAALQAGNLIGDAVANRVLSDSSKSKGSSVPKQRAAPKDSDVVVGKSDQFFCDAYVSPVERGTGHGVSIVAQENVHKSVRRFDPEADRQRRLGMYAGLLTTAAGTAGYAASHNFTRDIQDLGGTKLRGVAVKPGKGKRAAALSALAALTATGGVGAYKRGISERNNPWN